MRRLTDSAGDDYSKRALENEKNHLLLLWELSDNEAICFISIDLEGPAQGITELGLAFQSKHDARRACRHIIVQSTQHLKANSPKPSGFGVVSEALGDPQDLFNILDDLFTQKQRENFRVVLTGFDMKTDLERLDDDCGWRPPGDVTILDTAFIFKAFSGRNSHPTLEKSLAAFGFQEDPSAPFHNAANDAWFTLELLFRKAEQAKRQIKDPTGEATINWLKPTNTPPSSPIISQASNAAMRLSRPFDWSCRPPRPAPQTPSSAADTPRAPHPSRRRKRRRHDQSGTPSEAVDSSPSESRPEKKRKLVGGGQSDGPVVEEGETGDEVGYGGRGEGTEEGHVNSTRM